MPRILSGTVVSVGMTNTIVVEVTRHVPHPLYRKLMKKSKKHKVHVDGNDVTIGQLVKIVETKPISKDKHFKLFVSDGTKTKVSKETDTSKETKVVKTEKVEATIALAEEKPKKAVKKAKKEGVSK